MIKAFVLASAAALATAAAPPASAAPSVAVDFAGTSAIPASNDFQALLAGLGLTRFAASGASLFLDAPAWITFEFLGSESGYSDRFDAGALSFQESTSFENHFSAPILIGTQFFAGGALAGFLNFTSSGGAPATIGQNGFGIFLGANQASGGSLSTFYLGYDDQISNQDDDYDDFIVRGMVSSPIPEPATWAMMIVGFGIAIRALRRDRRNHEMLRQFS